MAPAKENQLRWGILGAAEIAQKNWKAIQLSGNGTVTAVASRDARKARAFVDLCQAEAPMEQAPRALGSYEQLLASPDVDAVYIPLPTGIRKEWVLRAAAAGKHIVCEKPCAVTVSDLRQMLDACRAHRVQFMDGVMFVHSRRFQQLRELLDRSEPVGSIRRVTSAFSFRGSQEFFASNIRVHGDLEPLGCLGDLGWYCLRLALWVMNWKMPLSASGRLLSQGSSPGSRNQVPTEFSGELLFADNVSAGFYCSFITQIEQWAIISGTGGYAHLGDFVLPFAGPEISFATRQSNYRVNGCDFRMETDHQAHSIQEFSHGHGNAQEMNCYRAFARQVLSGTLDESWPATALKTQIALEACLASARRGGAPVPVPSP